MRGILITLITLFAFGLGNAQNIDELKSLRAEKQTLHDAKAAEAGAIAGEIAGLSAQIDLLSGWRTGFAGMIGLNVANSEKWAANPNPTSNSVGLSVNLNLFANRTADKWFWNNKLVANKAWQSLSVNGADAPDLFDSGTVDLLNISSLYGYKVSKTLAVSALGELNTGIENFLEPGTVDIGAGITWTPIPNLFVVVHPLNYRVAFSGLEAVDSEAALGAKLRVDYSNKFVVSGKDINWSSTLTGFFPYGDTEMAVVDGDGVDQLAGLNEFTWLNTVSFNVWKGIGVGATLGLRKADFEVYEELQRFYTVGLSYAM